MAVVDAGWRRAAMRRGVMRLTAVLVGVAGAAAACGQSPTDVEGTCVAVVNIDGTFMTTGDGVLPADSVGAAYVTIGRNTGCLDQGEPPDPLGPGESNFLEVGTTLYRVPGFAAVERLAYESDTGEWLTLTALAGYADVTLAIGDEVVVPGSVLSVGLTSIVTDSRCPVDVTCVWAGDVEIEIGLALGSGPTSPHRLHLNAAAGSTSVEYSGYRIRLVSVAPVAQSTVVIDPDDYRVRLLVETVGQG